MKLVRDYQLVYEGTDDTGEVAKRNIRDYFIIIGELPDDLQTKIKKINQDYLVYSMIQSGDYNYSANYSRAVRAVNDLLSQHQDELNDSDEGILGNAQVALFRDHLATSRIMAEDTSNMTDDDYFNVFVNHVQQSFDEDPQSAIYLLINRYGLDTVDKYLADEHIERDDRLHYTYRGIYDDEKNDIINYFDIEEVMYHGEYGVFAPMPAMDVEKSAQDYHQLRTVSLWRASKTGQALDLIREKHEDVLEEVLEDYEVIDSESLKGNLQIVVQDKLKQGHSITDNDILRLFDLVQQVAHTGDTLWNIEGDLNRARPLNAHEVLDILQEVADRIDE